MATNDPRFRPRTSCGDCGATMPADEVLRHTCPKQAARLAQVRDHDRRAVREFLLVLGVAALALWIVIEILGWIAEMMEGTK